VQRDCPRGWLTEDDHFAGHHNDPVKAPIPRTTTASGANPRGQEWPRETLRNPDRSPLLWSAAIQRGVRDYLELILARYSAGAPEFLEMLDAWLRRRIGERWFEEFKADTGWEKP
jgi:hypothetical protein